MTARVSLTGRGVGHRADVREAAGGRGGEPARDVLLVLLAGLAQVACRSTNAGKTTLPGTVDDASVQAAFRLPRRAWTDAFDAPLFDDDVGNLVEPGCGIESADTFDDQELRHCPTPDSTDVVGRSARRAAAAKHDSRRSARRAAAAKHDSRRSARRAAAEHDGRRSARRAAAAKHDGRRSARRAAAAKQDRRRSGRTARALGPLRGPAIRACLRRCMRSIETETSAPSARTPLAPSCDGARQPQPLWSMSPVPSPSFPALPPVPPSGGVPQKVTACGSASPRQRAISVQVERHGSPTQNLPVGVSHAHWTGPCRSDSFMTDWTVRPRSLDKPSSNCCVSSNWLPHTQSSSRSNVRQPM